MTTYARRSARVADRDGLHARPCAQIAGCARRSRSDVFLECAGAKADAKSVLELLLLNAPHAAEVTVEATGPDAEDVASRIVEVVGTVPRSS